MCIHCSEAFFDFHLRTLSTDYVSPELSAQIIHAELIRTISQSKYDLAIGICRSADSQVSAFIIIDFEFIYQEVKDCYGGKGNVSVPPPVILKMMLLLILYNVRSERIVWQCAEAGLVDGSKLFMDSSLVDADAFNNSVVNVNKETLKIHLVRSYNELECRLEEKDNPEEDHEPKSGAANRNHISTTDPDASVTSQGAGKPKLQYKTHRSVDAKAEIITATEVTPGEVNEDFGGFVFRNTSHPPYKTS